MNKTPQNMNKDIIHALQHGLPAPQSVGKVLIVGAGIAGLAAAQILLKSGIEVQILEATERFGGRIYTLTDFAKSPVEGGAEEIHGGKTAWADLAEIHQKTLLNTNDYSSLYFLENQLWKENEAYTREDFDEMEDFYDLLEEADFSDTVGKISVAQFLDVIESPPTCRHIIEAWISNSYGASMTDLDARELQTLWKQWTAGEVNFMFENAGYIELLAEVCADALPTIQYAKPISQIEYTENHVCALTPKGEVFEGNALVLTVPLGVLKKQFITFSPPLPAPKTEAIECIGVGAGLKILLKFKESFWDDNVGAIYGNGYISEFYPSAKDDEAILTALVMGDNALYLSNLTEEEAIQTALQELDMMGNNTLASELFEKGTRIDWTVMPFQWGAYSYPSTGSGQARLDLAKALPPLYFAGEATHTEGHIATVHGALETAYRAVHELLGRQG